MEMPKGWKALNARVCYSKDFSNLGRISMDEGKLGTLLDLLKEMAEALDRTQGIAEMTMPNGSVEPKALYEDVTPILEKFKAWK